MCAAAIITAGLTQTNLGHAAFYRIRRPPYSPFPVAFLLFTLEPLRRDLAQHTLARSQTRGSILLISCGTQPTLVQYLLGCVSITMTLDPYSHWIPSMGRHAADGMDEALG
jgi:hypothetical protein